MRRRFVAGSAVGALALAACVVSILPPAARATGAREDARVMRGVLHVHSRRSDGTGTMRQIAAAAARAGLGFVIVTDHGDGTRAPDPPRYVDGVLCIDAVEISTAGGHYLAIGLPRTPYRLGGEPRDVVEDVRRLGGIGIVAHPGSPKAELRWREWTAPIDGLEWLNADSEWRDEPRRLVLRSLVTYWFRAPETIAHLFDRPSTVLARWDALAARRRVIGVAGQDAHARMGARGNWEPADHDASLRLPSYEAAFRTFSLRVITGTRTGNAIDDAARLLAALRTGHVYTVIDAFAGPAPVSFTATGGGRRAGMGDGLPAGGDAVIEASVPAVPGVSLRLVRDGRTASTAEGHALRFVHRAAAGHAAYRLEAYLPDAPGSPQTPWIVTNPIYVGPARPPLVIPPPPATAVWRALTRPGESWHVEHAAGSRAAIEAAGTAGEGSREPPDVTLEYALAAGARRGQYSAVVLPLERGSLATWSRVRFEAQSDRAMRVSVQLRDPDSGRRWLRSIVLGPAARDVIVPFSDMTPVDDSLDRRAHLEAVDSLLFVVDTTHSAPGDAGRVTIRGLRVERAGK